MNLYERFWNKIDELRQDQPDEAEAFDLSLMPVHPPDGVRSEAGRDLAAIVKRAPRRFPPYVAAQPSASTRPFCVIYTVAKPDLPQFHELFEQYVDKNAFIAETFLCLRPHCDIPYILFIGPKSFFLYDAVLEELIRWGSDLAALKDTLLDMVESRTDVATVWNSIPRKTNSQRGEEFGRWLDLWKVGIGARTSATPAFMQMLMQKVLLLFVYDMMFGLSEPELRLRLNFLDQRVYAMLAGKANSISATPFDGVAWLHQASAEVLDRYDIDFLEWTSAESNFFALMSADTRQQFSQFVLELFLLSQAKFCSGVQTDVFSDANSKLKLWKFSVTETLKVKVRLQADEINVYEPIWVDLDESGIGWALHVTQQVLEFWHARCSWFDKQLTEHRQLKLQFDMFQQRDLSSIHVPTMSDIFDEAFSTSIRVYYDFPAEKATLEYLIILKVFELSRTWSGTMRPLEMLTEVFVEKERMASVQDI